MSLAEEMEAWTAAQGKRLIIAAYQGESDRVSATLAEPFGLGLGRTLTLTLSLTRTLTLTLTLTLTPTR